LVYSRTEAIPVFIRMEKKDVIAVEFLADGQTGNRPDFLLADIEETVAGVDYGIIQDGIFKHAGVGKNGPEVPGWAFRDFTTLDHGITPAI